jgi:hypothetical protein
VLWTRHEAALPPVSDILHGSHDELGLQ